MNHKQELLNFVTTKTGSFNAKVLTKEYFQKHSKPQLWDFIFSSTSHWPSETSLRDRLHIIKNSWNLKPCKICQTKTCQIIHYDGTRLSNYCSPVCAALESENKKLGRRKVDEIKANQKRIETMVKKYGVPYNSQRKEVKVLLQKPKMDQSVYSKLSDKEWLEDQYIKQKRTSQEIGDSLGCYYGTVISYLKGHSLAINYRRSTSLQEKEVIDFLKDNSIKTEQSLRTIIPPKEIDIFSSDHSIGIELNGLFWHSFNRFETRKEKNEHLHKTLACQEKGKKLIHITDYEWKHKQDIIKSMLLNRFAKTKDILGARECNVQVCSKEETQKFLEETHIQGYIPFKVSYGLYKDGELLSILTLGKPRFNKKYEWEILRFSSRLNTTVVGGFSRLFKQFISDYSPTTIITYSDRRFGEGNLYSKNGFKLLGSTHPGYFWTDGDSIISRYVTQRKKMKKWLPNYSENLSEAQNMFSSGYRRFWDCGNNVFIWK